MWDYLKNHHPRRERFTCHALDWVGSGRVGSVVGKRESARVLGDVVLTEHDCHRDRRWPDRIAGAGWYLDLHNPYGLLDVSVPGEPSSVDETYRAWVRVPPFSVPLRSCVSRDVANLWLGGRLVSATHAANGALRVQLTLGQLGQATGIAAAHALAHGIDPRDVATAPHIGAVQQRALLRDVRIPGVVLDDPDDLAPLATVSASSEAVLDLATPEPADTRELDRPWAQVFPVSTGRIETIGVHLRNDGPAAPLRWRLEEVDTLWQRESGRRVAHGRATVAAGHDGVLSLEVGALTRPVLHRLVVRGRPGVHWTAARGQPVGTVAQVLHVATAGRHSGAQLPRFVHWGQDKWVSLTVDCDPPQRPYGPGNVVTGVAHPEAGTNLWASDPGRALPQWLRLDWPWPVRLDELALWFDTNLNTKLGLAPGQWTPPETVRDYTVDGRTAGGWRRMATVSGNRTRLNRLDLPPWPVTALRLSVSANHERPPDTDLSRQFGYWRRDGDRAVRDDGPRGARIYQVVAHGARISPAPSRRDGAPAGG